MDGKTIALKYRQLGGVREGGPTAGGILLGLWGNDVEPTDAQAFWDKEIIPLPEEHRRKVFEELLVLLPSAQNLARRE